MIRIHVIRLQVIRMERKIGQGNGTEYDREDYSRAIYHSIVDKRRMFFRVKEPFKNLIQPYDPYDKYPMCKIGNFARVTQRYLENWINIEKVIKRIERSKAGSALQGLNEDEKRELVTKTLYKIGNDSYLSEEEWKGVRSFRQIDSTIEPGTGVTLLANNLLARSVEEKVNEFYLNKGLKGKEKFVICDIGPGSGNSIVPIIDNIDRMSYRIPAARDYAESLEVILIDGQQEALNKSTQRLRKRTAHRDNFRFPLKNISQIRENFGNLRNNRQLTDYLGKVDLIISGAAIMHNTYKQPFFSAMYSLLKEEGVFCCWDWNFKNFIAPSIRFGEVISRVMSLEDRYSSVVRTFTLEEDEPFPGEIKSKEKNCFTKVIGTLPEKELSLGLQNNINWLWLYGYIRKNPTTGKREEKDIYNLVRRKMEPVSNRLREMFWRKVDSAEGFNFIEDFLPLLTHIHPYDHCAYNYIEGYGDDYSHQLRREFFSFTKDISLRELMETLTVEKENILVHERNLVHEDLVQKDFNQGLDETKKEMIRFTYACKSYPDSSIKHLLGK